MEKYKDSRLSAEERAEDLLSRMTVREKVGQLNQRLYGFASYLRDGKNIELSSEFKQEVQHWSGLGVLYGLYRADPWSKRDFNNGLEEDLAIKAYNCVQKYVVEHSRFGIPMLLSSECPHGHQALDGYLLPVNLAMGASWNPKLVSEAYSVCAQQMKEMGVNLALISMLDVLRDPRWGRSEECYSEDPYLCAVLAESAVRGCQDQGVVAVAKHFCAQGEGTGGINASAARIGERELREIHLPPAFACCKAGVKGIMAAYNEIDGIPCHANSWLLNNVLRQEMGFDGIVMADGIAIDRLNILTGDTISSGALALKSGVDISLWDEGFTLLEEALGQGLLQEQVLDQAVRRVLLIKFELGLFEQPYLEEKKPKRFTVKENPQSLELARQSAVLLKNDGLLPLDVKKITSIAVIGPNANDIYNQLGDYTPPLRRGEGVTLLEGLKELCPERVIVKYARGCGIIGGDETGLEEAVELASSCDVVILALGGSSSRFLGVKFDTNGAAMADDLIMMDCGEGVDSSELTLPGVQHKLAQAIYSTEKPVVTVLIQGRPYAVGEEANRSNAMLCSFYPGPEGGLALAEILLGKVCPSGCLPVSIPINSGQLPVYYNYKASYEAMNYWNARNTPLFPFGFGLSYTAFEVDNIVLDREIISLDELEQGATVQLVTSVKNTGNCAGHTVLQLFIRDLQASSVRRVKELKCFEKIYLEPGEKRRVDFNLGFEQLALWDKNMSFCVEPGEFLLELMESGKKIWQGSLFVSM